jgi:hypothetical protein
MWDRLKSKRGGASSASGEKPTNDAGRRKAFFLKKEPKTFAFLAIAWLQHRDQDTKVFCFFFSKKKAFSGTIRWRALHAALALLLFKGV